MSAGSNYPPGVTGSEPEIAGDSGWEAVHAMMDEDCGKMGWNDCDAFLAWRLGLAALKAARGVGGKFPSDAEEPTPSVPGDQWANRGGWQGIIGRATGSRVNDGVETCAVCLLPVPAKGGTTFEAVINPGEHPETVRRFTMHLACFAKRGCAVVGAFDTGRNVFAIQNMDGRCEDAPCCGCCNP